MEVETADGRFGRGSYPFAFDSSWTGRAAFPEVSETQEHFKRSNQERRESIQETGGGLGPSEPDDSPEP